jgi:hypothetical protein
LDGTSAWEVPGQSKKIPLGSRDQLTYGNLLRFFII